MSPASSLVEALRIQLGIALDLAQLLAQAVEVLLTHLAHLDLALQTRDQGLGLVGTTRHQTAQLAPLKALHAHGIVVDHPLRVLGVVHLLEHGEQVEVLARLVQRVGLLDGVALLLGRGVRVVFEQPLLPRLERFRQDDARLAEVERRVVRELADAQRAACFEVGAAGRGVARRRRVGHGGGARVGVDVGGTRLVEREPWP